MKMKSVVCIAGCALLSIIAQQPAPVLAEVLVNQHPATSCAPCALRSNLPGPESSQQVADDFSLGVPAILTGIEWSGYYFGESLTGLGSTVDFTVRLFADPPPPVPLVSESLSATFSQTGMTTDFNDPIYRFSAPLSNPVLLSAGTTYWLSVLESDVDTNVDFLWLATSATFNQIRALRSNEGNAWSIEPNTEDFAFTLIGTVIPEPSSITAVVFMVLAVAVGYRSRSLA